MKKANDKAVDKMDKKFTTQKTLQAMNRAYMHSFKKTPEGLVY